MSNSQNIYDDQRFFAEYKKLREQQFNYNKLLEQPAVKSLLPDVAGMTILDLGCGFGDNCVDFIRRGARRVVGVDVSEKMLEVAREQNADRNIEYRRVDMQDLGDIVGPFDLVFSSLAVHYVEDLPALLRDVHRLLRDEGLLVFSQEHPLTTAPRSGPEWINLENPEEAFYPLRDYSRPGERSTTWFVEGVRKYHRTFSEIMNALIAAGFLIEKVIEPVPDAAAIQALPSLAMELNKPSFLLVKARKN